MLSSEAGLAPVSSSQEGVVGHRPAGGLPWALLGGMALILVGVWLLRWMAPALLRGGLLTLSMHTVLEFAAILAALLVFSVAWHARSAVQPDNILIIGCGFLAVGLIDFGHAMSFQGMPDFVTPASFEKSIQFWLLARYTAALTLLVAALRPLRPMRGPWARYALLAGALAWAAAAYAIELGAPSIWPATFKAGRGLSVFKIVAEYGLVTLAVVTALVFTVRRDKPQFYSTGDLRTAVLVTILSELCLTLYGSASDVFMLLGHLYKVVACFFIYRAVFVTSVRTPYQRLSEEIEERREAERRAAFLACHDMLTGLPNRELARDRFIQAMADARRHETLVALIFLDLDHFKTINDSMGHAHGDVLLRRVAEVLRAHVRQSDTVSRQGGDEFLLILKDLPDADAVAHIVSKLIEEVARPLIIDGQDISTSASVGIAMAPNDGDDFDVLMQRADTAMYRAKAEGRNAYRFFDDRMNAESTERLVLRNGLRQALAFGQFVLHYQPQMDLVTGHVFGVEALIRWQHPQWGLVPPARFIPIAEESGLIVPIGEWVIQEACRQAAAWRSQGLPPLTMAVNLSAIQFKRGDVEQVVSKALAASGLPPQQLELELTESVLVSDLESVERRLKALKALGVKLAIDDFGTGYSSLSYLKRFSVDKLKIDQSFVRDLERNPEDVAIVRAVIHLAGGLGLAAIAEGVETAEVMQALRKLGCQEAQGYWFAKPMPATACEDWLQRQQGQSAEALDSGEQTRATRAVEPA